MSTYRRAGFYTELGERIRTLRVRAGLSQAALGARLGRSASAIDRYEMGQRRVALAELVGLAEILGVAPETLLPTGPEGRRRATHSKAAHEAADLRAEHLRLLRALDRRLFPSSTGLRGDVLAEDPGSYVSRPSGGIGGAPKRVATSFSDNRLRRWARKAGFPPTVGSDALRRYATLVLAEVGRAGRTRR